MTRRSSTPFSPKRNEAGERGVRHAPRGRPRPLRHGAAVHRRRARGWHSAGRPGRGDCERSARQFFPAWFDRDQRSVLVGGGAGGRGCRDLESHAADDASRPESGGPPRPGRGLSYPKLARSSGVTCCSASLSEMSASRLSRRLRRANGTRRRDETTTRRAPSLLASECIGSTAPRYAR